MKFLRPLVLLAAVLLPALGFAAQSPSQRNGSVITQLVSDAKTIEAGKPFTVALRMKHDPHWHSYWIAPGTGYPTSIAWTLPEGFTAGEIQWPTPHVVKDTAGTITGNGYEDEAFLLVEITPPATLAAGSSVKLTATADWLMCKDVCMPGDSTLSINFPVAASAEADSAWTKALADARQQLPIKNDTWTLTASHDGANAILILTPKAGTTHKPEGLHLFTADAFTDYAATQTIREENGSWIIETKLDAAADAATEKLVGILAASNGWGASAGYGGLAIDVPFTKANSGQPSAVSGQSPTSNPPASGNTGDASAAASSTSLIGTIFFAFLGGLVLNLMPCVFPVLGIKILGFVNQAGSERRKVVIHGLVFSAGVLISFWALAGLLLVLRAGGEQLGWGFQLQSPAFVFGMAVFLLIFALNLSGLFEIGLSATGAGANLQSKEGYSGSFFTGALAVLVATPCSAPFLAPALGAALALSSFESLLVFTAIAVGLALPYLLLSLFPQAIKFLPRPGAWMETFKQFMAFPLYATVGALLWVLAAQTADDDYGLLLIAFGFVFVAMATWVYGRFGQAFGKPARQTFGKVAGALLLVTGLWVGWPKDLHAATPAGETAGYQVNWEKWSPEAVAAAQAAGKFVYVDFTARWCATCQTNKAAVFTSQDVLKQFGEKNVVLLKADWTNKDPLITQELAKWNRSAIPFNLIYAPSKADPVVLPELLTPDRVLESLNQAASS
jgi:thiol:disulfide interchange protein